MLSVLPVVKTLLLSLVLWPVKIGSIAYNTTERYSELVDTQAVVLCPEIARRRDLHVKSRNVLVIVNRPLREAKIRGTPRAKLSIPPELFLDPGDDVFGIFSLEDEDRVNSCLIAMARSPNILEHDDKSILDEMMGDDRYLSLGVRRPN